MLFVPPLSASINVYQPMSAQHDQIGTER